MFAPACFDAKTHDFGERSSFFRQFITEIKVMLIERKVMLIERKRSFWCD